MEALILETYPRGEADIVVRLLLRDGRRIDALARGARQMSSKLRAGIVPMSVSYVGLIAGRGGHIAHSVQPYMVFNGVDRSRVTDVAARVLLRHAAAATTDMLDDAIYPELVRTLRELHIAALAGEGTLDLYRRWAAAWIRLLELLGFGPNFAMTPIPKISQQGARTLMHRRVPEDKEDVSRLLSHLAAHSREHLPETTPTLAWCSQALMRGTMKSV